MSSKFLEFILESLVQNVLSIGILWKKSFPTPGLFFVNSLEVLKEAAVISSSLVMVHGKNTFLFTLVFLLPDLYFCLYFGLSTSISRFEQSGSSSGYYYCYC